MTENPVQSCGCKGRGLGGLGGCGRYPIHHIGGPAHALEYFFFLLGGRKKLEIFEILRSRSSGGEFSSAKFPRQTCTTGNLFPEQKNLEIFEFFEIFPNSRKNPPPKKSKIPSPEGGGERNLVAPAAAEGGGHPSPPWTGQPPEAFRRQVARYTALGGRGRWRPSPSRQCSGLAAMPPPAEGGFATDRGQVGHTAVDYTKLPRLLTLCGVSSFRL